MAKDADLPQLIDDLGEVLTETLAYVRTLDDSQGALPTGCPGWSVSDNLAHMVGLEQVLAGGAEPTVEVPEFDHVENDFGVYMETHIHARRALPLQTIADELAGFMPRRLEQLRDLASQGDPMVPGPQGERALSASLPIRVLDLWAHEHDIRHATGATARATGSSSSFVLGRCLGAWSAILPKKVDTNGLIKIGVVGDNSRAEETEIFLGEGGATLSIGADIGVLTRLGFGRGDAAATLAEANVEGPTDLVEAVLPFLSFTP